MAHLVPSERARVEAHRAASGYRYEMRDEPSFTAAWVASCRTLGRALPREAQLADDPLGARFAGRGVALLAEHLPKLAVLPLRPFAIYMQVRTRAIDDVLHRFVASGGRQIVILGAGYDCRASRFASELAESRVFEIDHPATQARKRGVLAGASARSAPVTYVPWDFEQRPATELPAALSDRGHVASRPTLTIWEGVTMYLTEPAIDAAVKAVGVLSSPGSRFVLTYFDRTALDKPSRVQRVFVKVVALSGEPFRFGWLPSRIGPWFDERGFALDWDKSMSDLARELLPASLEGRIRQPPSRIALFQKSGSPP